MTTEFPQQKVEPEVDNLRLSRRAVWMFVMLAILFAGAVGSWIRLGILSRTASADALVRETRETSILTVSVVHPQLNGAEEEVVLPGNIQAFTDSPIYARTTGYLKKWYVDIGTHVKAGELLAEIDAPELDHPHPDGASLLPTADGRGGNGGRQNLIDLGALGLARSSELGPGRPASCYDR